MDVYKLIFENNATISCEIMSGPVLEGSTYHYVHSNNKMIYALVKAESEENARQISVWLLRELSKNIQHKIRSETRPALWNN
jgi:hypothetical protein